MTLRVLSVGKKHDDWIRPGIERYQKRLKIPFAFDWVLLPPAGSSGFQARQDESKTILSRLKPDDYVVLLDETGHLLDSPTLSQRLLEQLEAARPVTLIIGGAYGVDTSIHERADLVWSLSPLVFPHQLVRLMLTEQLYRAQQIAQGGPYHHL